MSFQPDPLQTLYLWSLLFVHGGSAKNNEIKPELGEVRRPHGKITGKQRREELSDAGLIETWYQGRALMVSLSETGWGWANDHLDAAVSPRAQTGGPVLQAALTRLKAYFADRDGSLADLFAEPGAADEQSGPASDLEGPLGAMADLPQRIRTAYQRLAGGEPMALVRLADLRAELAEIPRSTLDSTLTEMSRAQQLLLVEGENPRDLTAADRAAELRLGGGLNHFLRME